MYYTLGNIVNAPGSNKIIVTRVALERYVEEDARGIALMAADTETPAPAYSVKGAGTEPVKLVLGSDVAADGIPDEYKSIQVQLAEQGKHAHTIAHFESDMLTGVEDVAAEAVRIAVAGRTVLISGTEAPAVVADMAGAVVYSGTSRSIGLQPGIYVVCVDGRTAKVMVR